MLSQSKYAPNWRLQDFNIACSKKTLMIYVTISSISQFFELQGSQYPPPYPNGFEPIISTYECLIPMSEVFGCCTNQRSVIEPHDLHRYGAG